MARVDVADYRYPIALAAAGLALFLFAIGRQKEHQEGQAPSFVGDLETAGQYIHGSLHRTREWWFGSWEKLSKAVDTYLATTPLPAGSWPALALDHASGSAGMTSDELLDLWQAGGLTPL